jgi:hypothetical protein
MIKMTKILTQMTQKWLNFGLVLCEKRYQGMTVGCGDEG